MEDRTFTTSDGLTLAWYDMPGTSSEPPVILQHGFSSSFRHEWVDCGIADAIHQTGRRVIGLDARGHGQSDKPHESRFYGENHMARDLMELVADLGLASYDLVGYSMGGTIATVVATLDSRLRRVVISGVGEAVVLTGGVDRRVLDTKALAAGLRAASADSFPPIVQGFRQGALERGNDLLALAAHSDAVADRTIAFDAIRVPTLILAGDADPLARQPERLAGAIAGARLVLVPGDHGAARRSPEYLQAVLDFLA